MMFKTCLKAKIKKLVNTTSVQKFKFHCPCRVSGTDAGQISLSQHKYFFALAGFEKNHTVFFHDASCKNHGFCQDKASMSKKLKEIFVRHSATSKCLSCPQSSYPVEKISQYLCFSNFSKIFYSGFQFQGRRLYVYLFSSVVTINRNEPTKCLVVHY